MHILNDKQCRSRSVGFFRRQLIWIYTVCKGRIYPGSAGLGLTILDIFIAPDKVGVFFEWRDGGSLLLLFCFFFIKKVLIFFSYFSTKTYMLWYSLEVPQRDTSNEYSQHILLCLVFYIPFYLSI